MMHVHAKPRLFLSLKIRSTYRAKAVELRIVIPLLLWNVESDCGAWSPTKHPLLASSLLSAEWGPPAKLTLFGVPFKRCLSQLWLSFWSWHMLSFVQSKPHMPTLWTILRIKGHCTIKKTVSERCQNVSPPGRHTTQALVCETKFELETN